MVMNGSSNLHGSMPCTINLSDLMMNEVSVSIASSSMIAYFLWASISITNIGFAAATVFALNNVKSLKNHIQLIMIHRMFYEIFGGIWIFGLAAFHLHYFYMKKCEVTRPRACYNLVAILNTTAGGSSLFTLAVSFEQLLAITLSGKYKTKSTTCKYCLLGGIYLVTILLFIIGFFDSFSEAAIPVCTTRLGTGRFMAVFFPYYLLLLNTAPLLFYGLSHAILVYQCRRCSKENHLTNLAFVKERRKDKIVKALLFATIWNSLTVMLFSFSTFILNKFPFKGAVTAPYFRILYLTNGIACFFSYFIFVDKFREFFLTNAKVLLNKAKVNNVS